MSRTLPSSEHDQPDCDRCQEIPCVCHYIKELRVGGAHERLREVALRQAALPQPHRAACPCPACYAQRRRTWDDT